MASFGWSSGDVIATSTLAWKLYKACENMGHEFQSLSKDVHALQSLLQDVGNELHIPSSIVHKAGKSKRQQLVNLINDCNTDLRDLERYLIQYRSLKSGKPRMRDRFRFGIKSISSIRQKLSKHRDGLDLFLTHANATSLGRLEQVSDTSAGLLDEIKGKLDRLHHDVQTGRRDISVLNARANWSELKHELVGDRITELDVTSNRDSIQDYVANWLEKTNDGQQDDESSKGEAGSRIKRTSSMAPWAPISPIDAAQVNLSSPLRQRYLVDQLEEPCPSPADTVVRHFFDDDNEDEENSTPVPSECSFGEDESVYSDQSAQSLQSYQSTTITTPDVVEYMHPPEYGCGSYVADLSDCASSTEINDIDSLIGELDAFALDISRHSTPQPRDHSQDVEIRDLEDDNDEVDSDALESWIGTQDETTEIEEVRVVNISFLESLCGWSRVITTIGGKELCIKRSEVTPPTWSHVYAGLGMPLKGHPGARADLVVKVDVEYPGAVSPYQKKILERAFGPGM